jgi:hypothetical protein
MEHRGNEIRDLAAARRRFPEGSVVQVVSGLRRGELAVVECIDEATFQELGEIVVWLDRGQGADYEPCSVMLAEIMLMPARQAMRSRSSGVRKRGVTRTGPSMRAKRSAMALAEDAAS